jgi:hypothetical protein
MRHINPDSIRHNWFQTMNARASNVSTERDGSGRAQTPYPSWLPGKLAGTRGRRSLAPIAVLHGVAILVARSLQGIRLVLR